jgi:CRISPR/Cas system-associated exonuclease Cas4 (RecB family)
VLYNLEGNSTVVTRRSDVELEAAKSRVKEVSENVAAGKFQPKPGFYCKFCAYRNLCPATEKQLQDHSPQIQADTARQK